MRLFIAIDLPDHLRSHVQSICPATLAGAKWLPMEQFHLTLRFIGDVEADRFQQIQQTLTQIARPTFNLSLKGVGVFPNLHRPRVLWVGLDVGPALLELQKDIEARLVELGIPAEDRPFSPHLTLARFKFSNAHQVAKYLEEQGTFCSEPFTVGQFILYSSLLTPKGALHKKEVIFNLTGSREI